MIKVKIFTASWCGYCRNLIPACDKLKEEHPGLCIEFIDIETPEGREEWRNLRGDNLMVLPLVVICKDCEIISITPGVVSYVSLNELVINAIGI